MLRAEREQQALVGRRRLQLEVELPAEALAQRQCPGAVHAAAERRVQHQLHAAGLVEEPFEHDRLPGRQRAEDAQGLGEVRDDLLGRRRRHAERVSQPGLGTGGWGRLRRVFLQQLADDAAKLADRRRQLDAPSRRLAQPEGNRRRRAVRVGDPNDARGHLQDPPGAVAELKDVAGVALDGEVLVQRADEQLLGLEHDAIVGVVGNRAARGDRGQARRPPPPQLRVHFVAMHQRAAPAAPGREALGEHAHDGVELRARKRAVRPGLPDEIEQAILGPLLAGGLGDQLLRQHVERRVERHQGIELAPSDGPDERRALDQIVAGLGEQPALWRADHRVAGAADALQQRRDAPRRSELADQVDVPDVDAELERRRRDDGLHVAVLEPALRVEPAFLRQAAMMRGDVLVAQPVRETPRDALGHLARVDEDERGAVLENQRRQPVVVLLPHLARHDGFKRRPRHLERQVEIAPVPLVDHRAVGRAGLVHVRASDEKARDLVHRALRRRQADPLQGLTGQRGEALQRQREMGAAPRADDGVNLVDDDGPHRPQALAAALRRQQQVQRFRRRDEDVRRRAEHRLPRRGRRVAGAHGGGDGRRRQSERRRLGRNCRARRRQVRVDVAAQRLERRHVDDADLVGQRRLQSFGEQVVEGDQERGQRLPGPGRRGNQRVAALADRRPALRLSRRRRAERGGKPPLHGGVKRCKRGRQSRLGDL